MSLLSICQSVAEVTPDSIPASIVGNTGETASLLYGLAKREGQRLARMNWTILQKEYTFQTVASQRDYALPSDYSRLINQTLWDRTNFWEMRGPLTPQEWQIRRSSVLSNTVSSRKRFRIRNISNSKQFSIDPLPDAADDLVYEYIMNTWCQSSGGAPQTTWLADTDTAFLDEHLIELGVQWRYLNRRGMAYAEEKDEYDREVAQAFARDGGAPTLQLAGGREFYFIGTGNVPDTGYGP